MCGPEPEPLPIVTVQAAIARATRLMGRELTRDERLVVTAAAISHNARVRGMRRVAS